MINWFFSNFAMEYQSLRILRSHTFFCRHTIEAVDMHEYETKNSNLLKVNERKGC